MTELEIQFTPDERELLFKAYMVLGTVGLMDWRRAAEILSEVRKCEDVGEVDQLFELAGMDVPDDEAMFGWVLAKHFKPGSLITPASKKVRLRAAKSFAEKWDKYCLVDVTPGDERVKQALSLLERYGDTDEAHHMRWVIDQVVRALAPNYEEWVREIRAGNDGPDSYDWDTGTAP